jgi:transcriptional regulator with XRE-family HTH domain
MEIKIQMTGRLLAAGRVLAGISQEDFAAIIGMPVETVCSIEANGSAWIHSSEDAERISRALDEIGILTFGEAGGMGAGVKLKFTRQDVKQVMRLENEGGNAALDSAP